MFDPFSLIIIACFLSVSTPDLHSFNLFFSFSHEVNTTVISRAPDQNGMSRLHNMFEISHSDLEPSTYIIFKFNFCHLHGIPVLFSVHDRKPFDLLDCSAAWQCDFDTPTSVTCVKHPPCTTHPPPTNPLTPTCLSLVARVTVPRRWHLQCRRR